MSRRRKMRHRGCWPGKRVLVKLRGEQLFVDVFEEGGRDYILLRDRRRIRKADVEFLTIYKAR